MKRRRRRNRRNRWLIVLVVLVALYAAGGFLVAPRVLRTQLTERLAAALQRDVTVEKIQINPFACSVTIEGLRIVDLDGADLAGWRRAYANFDPLMSLFRWRWQLGEIHLIDPHQRLRIGPDGSLNISDILAANPEGTVEAEAQSGLPAFGVSQLLVEGWSVDFTDASRRSTFRTVLGPMSFTVTDFSTRPGAASPYAFSGTTDSGEAFSWSGTIAAQPLGSRGQVEFVGFLIPKHMPFAEEYFSGRVASGRLTFRTEYAVTLATEPKATLANTTLLIEGLALTEATTGSGEVRINRFELAMPAADAIARTADVSRIAVDGLELNGTRRKDGSIDLLDLLPVAAPNSGEADAPATGPAPSIGVAEISLANSRIAIVDETNARPTSIRLDGIAATLTNTGTDLDREVGVDANMNLNENGTLAVNGRIRARPLAAQLDVTIDDVPLDFLDVYAPTPANVRVTRGSTDVTGRFEAESPPGAALALRWSGDAEIKNINVTDDTGRYKFLSWDRLAFGGTRVSSQPLSVSVQEITWDSPVIHASVTPDGRFTWAEAFGAAGDDSGRTEPPPSEDQRIESANGSPLPVRIDAVVINDGRVTVHDRSTRPEFQISLNDFSGSIYGLSSDAAARAAVDLHASLDRGGSLAVNGAFNPLAEDLFTDVTVNFHDVLLPPFSPYAGRYLGRTVKSGVLDLDLDYRVSQNVLEGDNRILLDQLYLGDTVESDQVLPVPIGLALAVLRNRDGVIKLPPTKVEGSLDDPDFRLGPLIAHALTNVFVKAATAPFAMLGSMFGARQDQDLSFVDFNPGSAVISDEAAEKLPILAAALFESPALGITIHAPSWHEIDRPVLHEQKFEALLREEKRLLMLAWATTTEESPVANATEVSVGADEVDDLVRYAFARRFPERAGEVDLAESTNAAEASAASTDSSEAEGPESNAVQKILRTVFGAQKPAELATAPSTTADAETAAAAAAEAVQPSLTLAEMREQLRATIEVPDVNFQNLVLRRAEAIRNALVASGKVEPERITLAAQPSIPKDAEVPADAARVYFGLE